MSELDELIKADAENIPKSRKALIRFDPELSRALDAAAGMFKTFGRCMEGALDDSADMATILDCAKQLGIDEKTLVVQVESDTGDAALNRARTAWLRLLAHRARGIIFLLLQRQFMWAATDLLRVRLTPAIGYGRQEAESLGLLFLMRDDPNIADRWLKLVTDSDGKMFYREFQGRIAQEIERLGLSRTYEQGSGTSLHVRFASAVRGLSKGKPHEVGMVYQEARDEDQFSYFLTVLGFLHTQDIVFQALGDAFPEVSDPIWPERVRRFSQTVASLRERLETTFPEQCKKHRQMAGEN